MREIVSIDFHDQRTLDSIRNNTNILKVLFCSHLCKISRQALAPVVRRMNDILTIESQYSFEDSNSSDSLG